MKTGDPHWRRQMSHPILVWRAFQLWISGFLLFSIEISRLERWNIQRSFQLMVFPLNFWNARGFDCDCLIFLKMKKKSFIATKNRHKINACSANSTSFFCHFLRKTSSPVTLLLQMAFNYYYLPFNENKKEDTTAKVFSTTQNEMEWNQMNWEWTQWNRKHM